MAQAVSAYRSISASGEFKELERLRARARHDEASALANERRQNSIQIATNLKNMGFDVDAIAKSTGLTVDDVLRL